MVDRTKKPGVAEVSPGQEAVDESEKSVLMWVRCQCLLWGLVAQQGARDRRAWGWGAGVMSAAPLLHTSCCASPPAPSSPLRSLSTPGDTSPRALGSPRQHALNFSSSPKSVATPARSALAAGAGSPSLAALSLVLWI